MVLNAKKVKDLVKKEYIYRWQAALEIKAQLVLKIYIKMPGEYKQRSKSYNKTTACKRSQNDTHSGGLCHSSSKRYIQIPKSYIKQRKESTRLSGNSSINTLDKDRFGLGMLGMLEKGKYEEEGILKYPVMPSASLGATA